MSRFPQELFNEIIGYLWNDIPSLKACSLAHRNMTFQSQKRLFYSICLRAPTEQLNNLELVKNEISGTSYDFWRLLVRSPHIAKYVQSLFVIDYCPGYARLFRTFKAQDVDSASSEDDQTESGLEYVTLTRGVATNPPGWLDNDKYLPRCALLLHNVKAFTLKYNDSWQYLSSKVHIALLRLMRLSSLLYVRLESHYPSALLNAIGDNVKHVGSESYRRPGPVKLPLLPEYLSSEPLYLDSLNIRYADEFPLNYFGDPNWRMEISRLRKLVIIADIYEDHLAAWKILHICRETLEDFEFTPARDVMIFDFGSDDPIDLSKLTSLKRFVVHLISTLDDSDPESIDYPTIPWLNEILQPKNAPPAGQQLEEISILLFSYDKNDLLPDFLNDTFDILLDNRFKTLKKINISIGSDLEEANKVVDMLNSSKHVAKLRSQEDIVVDVRVCSRPLHFVPDVRWETICWKRWNHLDVHDDCRKVSQVW